MRPLMSFSCVVSWLWAVGSCGCPQRPLDDPQDAGAQQPGLVPSAGVRPASTSSEPTRTSTAGASSPAQPGSYSSSAASPAGHTSSSAAVSHSSSQVPQPSTSLVAAAVVTGGPCLSGAAGQTAWRVQWEGSQGGTATPRIVVWGLPDSARSHVGAYGYQIGYSATYDDTFLGPGGLQLDGSDFVDVQLSTAGLIAVERATLSVLGRSFNTTAPGGFSWQTLHGAGATADDLVSNSAPYEWYTSGNLAPVLPAGDSGLLMRIKATGRSGALVVNQMELCVVAR